MTVNMGQVPTSLTRGPINLEIQSIASDNTLGREIELDLCNSTKKKAIEV